MAGLKGLRIDSEPFDLADIISVLSLPGLRNVSLGNFFANITTVNEKRQKFARPRTSNIVQLVLYNCCIDVDCMAELIQSCETLQHLTYNANRHGNLYNFTPNELSELLLCQKGSLHTLEVGLQHANLREQEYEYGSFDQFSKLTSLRIEQIYMRDGHKLPDSLRKLCLEDCVRSVFGFLGHVSHLRGMSEIPDLKTIVLLLPSLYSSEDLGDCEMLGIDLSTATVNQVQVKCNDLLKITEDTRVSIHYDPDIWGKVVATKARNPVDPWEFEDWDEWKGDLGRFVVED